MIRKLIAPAAFVCRNWVIYWTGFRTNSFLFGLIAIGFTVYALHHHFVERKPVALFGWRNIAWLLPWFGGMWILSALGVIDGGMHVLNFLEGVVCVAIWSVFLLVLALRGALPQDATLGMMRKMGATARLMWPGTMRGRTNRTVCHRTITLRAVRISTQEAG